MPKDFSGQNLRGKSFKGQDLTGANFSEADIRGVNFQNATLVGANFSQTRAGLWHGPFVMFVLLSILLIALVFLFSQVIYPDILVVLLSIGALGLLFLAVLRMNLQERLYTNFQHANLENVSFSEALIEGRSFQLQNRKSIHYIQFTHAKLAHTCWFQAKLKYVSFSNADLTGADFTEATLEGTSFTEANLCDVTFHKAKKLTLHGPFFTNPTTIAINKLLKLIGWNPLSLQYRRAISEQIIKKEETLENLLITHNGENQSFKGLNLKRMYLVGANLQNADLTEVNLSNANLQNANLMNANLQKVQATGADFKGATLTGACIASWHIDSTTNLEGVICDYVYLLANKQERRPNSGTFGEGEFSKLFQEVLHTVDFIFKNGIDWQAFLVTFDSIREKIRIESDGADIAVQSIENKGDGVFVVKVVAQEVDRESLHREFTEQYKQQLAIQEAKYHALLQGKEEIIALQRQQATDMKEILHTLMQKQTVSITGGVVLGDSIHAGRDYFEQVAGDVTTGESASKPKKDP